MTGCGLGDHICWLYDDDDVLQATARFVDAGLRGGERVLCFTESLLPRALQIGLESHGVATDAAVGRGQLGVQRFEDAYLIGGEFDPERVIKALAGHIETAHRDGYQGLRIVADMGWALRRVSGVRQLSYYEAQVNRLFADGRVVGMCQYDRRQHPAADLRHVASAHPGVADRRDGGVGVPTLRMQRTAEPYGLRLAGQAELSNRQALLTFADVGALRLLLLAGDTAPAGSRVTGCQRQVARVLRQAGGPGKIIGVDGSMEAA